MHILKIILAHTCFIATVFGFAPQTPSWRASTSMDSFRRHSSAVKLNAFRATWEPFHVPWSSSWENIEFDVETDRKELALLGINDDFILNDDFIKREIEEQNQSNVAVIIKNANVATDKSYGP